MGTDIILYMSFTYIYIYYICKAIATLYNNDEKKNFAERTTSESSTPGDAVVQFCSTCSHCSLSIFTVNVFPFKIQLSTAEQMT